MPGIPFNQLLERFVQTLERSGATVFPIIKSAELRPASVQVIADDRTICLLYLWTVTGGGNNRSASERRIQVTGSSTFDLRPGSRTIVGGWNAEADVWCFWDARKHGRFSIGSPSFQATKEALEKAANEGVATSVRPVAEGTEVVVAVHPDYLLWYVQEGFDLHNTDEDANAISSLLGADGDEERAFVDEADTEHQQGRRLKLVQVVQRFRDAQFRPEVMRAYSSSCAVCGTALKLVDAAHIVPVNHPYSSDDVTNGIALCRLHHAAYDTGLIGIRGDLRVVLNHLAADRLQRVSLDGGLEAFSAALPETIRTPTVRDVWPDPDKLRLGMKVRELPALLIG